MQMCHTTPGATVCQAYVHMDLFICVQYCYALLFQIFSAHIFLHLCCFAASISIFTHIPRLGQHRCYFYSLLAFTRSYPNTVLLEQLQLCQ